jgi:GTP-binding protein HflX
LRAPIYPNPKNPEPAPFVVPGRAPERALLLHLRLTGRPQHEQEDVEELRLLATSAGAHVVGTIVGSRHTPDAGTFIGKGKAEEVRNAAAREQADVVLVNHALSPSQERNLEKVIGCRVLDRVGLILDIFAQRARSHEGKLQVELAQLEHLSTRLVRGWTHLERQKGGIGLRGPGETQLEVDRRLIRDRIRKLNDRLEQVYTQRRSRRRARHKVPIPTISLVGYTNAGKSTLFNRLTGAGVYAADQLFATLDPTMRRVELAGNTAVVLADTVGFIRHLPHDLVEAFKSTLEEVADADLLLHVTDSSHPERLEQMTRVDDVLEEIGAENIPQVVVFNKIDATGEAARIERGDGRVLARVWLSARSGEGVELLRDLLAEHYRAQRRLLRFVLPPQAGRLRAQIYERTEVRGETPLESGGWVLEAALTAAQLAWLQQQEDFRADYLQEKPREILAATGS